MISEKQMEDAIAANPEKFLEPGLKLVARQYRVGSYIFDLLFEDRRGGKLIVEIQKGTLDRNHTYKILDYYDEYKSRNPKEFVDLMIVYNRIPSERRQRLNAQGIDWKEIPVHLFQLEPENSDTGQTPMAVDIVSDNAEIQKNGGDAGRDVWKAEDAYQLVMDIVPQEYSKRYYNICCFVYGLKNRYERAQAIGAYKRDVPDLRFKLYCENGKGNFFVIRKDHMLVFLSEVQ